MDAGTGTAVRDAGRAVGGRLVADDGRLLALRGVTLGADVCGGRARTTLEHRFVNSYAEPLHVTYLVPLPADGAVAGYTIRVGERRVVGEVDRLTAARERFETALIEGRTAALVEEDRSNLFSQQIGNVPPGVDVIAELVVDHPLAWLADGEWEWRFPTVVAPRYLGADGRVADAERVTVDVAENGVAVNAHVALTIRDPLLDTAVVSSPSHAVLVTPRERGAEVAFGDPTLDRDVVARWRVAGRLPEVTLDVSRAPADRPQPQHAYAVLTVTPPEPGSIGEVMPRDLILLVDTSGSMAGEPLAQAKALGVALVDTLCAADRLELVAFSDRPRPWRSDAAPMTEAARRDAIAWLERLAAEGSTEMVDGVEQALRPLRDDAQRQVVLITDGLIGFESEIVAKVRSRLPKTSRLHTVGVGSSVNRALTARVARAGRGVEAVIGLGERVDRHVGRLVAQMRAPIVTNVTLSGSALVDHAPAALPDVYVGSPLRVALKLRPDGGQLILRGTTISGAWDHTLDISPVPAGSGSPSVISFYGREAVEDVELRGVAGRANVDREVERLGLAFQIATRLTAWVAVSEEPTVDPRQPIRRERIPHALPHGLSIEALGLRSSGDSVRLSFGRRSHSVSLGLSFVAPSFEVVLQPTLSQRPLRGRLVLRRGRELTMEVTVGRAVDWSPVSAKVRWSDGTVVEAEIVNDSTTEPGRLRAGLVARLSLRLVEDGPADPPKRIMLLGRAAIVILVD